jgi:putative ABC transport system permease protein
LVRALDRKLIRDLLQMKGQALAISLVMACGVATFVMSLSMLRSLSLTLDTYYERYRFAHVFLHLKRAPNSLAERIGEIPGVARVSTRTVVEVTLDVPGLPEPAVGRLISIPERPEPGLDELYLRSGRYIEPGRSGEALVSEAFAEAHKLQPGNRLVAVINGRRQELLIVGVALSPEYVFQIREGELLPDPKRFGLLWMGKPELAAAFDMQGAFNDVALALMPGASEEEVVRQLDRLTAPYGGLGAYGRAEQVSNRFITNELRELRGMAVIAPVIFLSVAAFLLNIVLSRLIGTQREQIAALKAFGYTHLEVGMHYAKFVLLISVAGATVGGIVGSWMGKNLTELYTRFFHFPVFRYHLDADVIVLAYFVSVGSALFGTFRAVGRAVRLPPAEAMRPEPPAGYRTTLIERLVPGFLISPAVRMILRHLGRQPVKSMLSGLGIALASAVLVLGSFMADALDYLIEFQFQAVQRHDVSIALNEPASARALFEIDHAPGVLHSEPFRSVAVRMRFGPRARRQAIMGLVRRGELFRLLDKDWRAIVLPKQGLVVSAKLAELLGAKTGDALTIEVLEGMRPVYQVPIVDLVDDYEGTSAYMELGAVNSLLQEGRTISGAFVSVDRPKLNSLYTKLKGTPRVGGVTVKQAAVESFRETVAENLMRMRAFNIAFACIIAFGVVYNCARISLSERSRDLATLRVIGFTRGEISLILLGELAVLTLCALPLGLLLGFAFAAAATLAYDTELFRIPLVVYPSTFGLAAAVTLLSSLASGLIVRRRLDHLDLVAVLKTKE